MRTTRRTTRRPPLRAPRTQQPPLSYPSPGSSPPSPSRLSAYTKSRPSPSAPGCFRKPEGPPAPGRGSRPAATGGAPSARGLPGEPAASPARTPTPPPPVAAFFLFLFFCFSFCFASASASAASGGSAMAARAPPPFTGRRKHRAPEGAGCAVHAGSGSPGGRRSRGARAGRRRAALKPLSSGCQGVESGFTVCFQNNTRFPAGLPFPGSKKVKNRAGANPSEGQCRPLLRGSR